MTNRPIVANDPTGHYCVGDVEECVAHDDVDEGGTGDGYQPPDPDDELSGDQGTNGAGAVVDPEYTVESLLLDNPDFDPFRCKYSSSSECIYSGSDMEKTDLAFLELYKEQGIDLDYYAARGLANPLQADLVPTELMGMLPRSRSSFAILLFIVQIEKETGQKLWGGTDLQGFLNYEPNYVYRLMVYHPDTLANAIDVVNNMPPGQYEQYKNSDDPGIQ